VAGIVLFVRTHQTTLQANVEGARAVLALARRCSRLRAMVHTSSAYVNINMPSGSAVQERIYPLMHGGVELDAEEIVQVRGSMAPLPWLCGVAGVQVEGNISIKGGR
jgi:hypothetical protein